VPPASDPGHDWSAVIEHETGAPVTLRSYGPTTLDKKKSRACGHANDVVGTIAQSQRVILRSAADASAFERHSLGA